MGDPAGIGAEVIVKALADPEIAGLARMVVVGDAAVLAAAGAELRRRAGALAASSG